MSLEGKAELWTARINDYRASGEPVATWCERNQVTRRQLGYWMRKLKKAERQTRAASGPKWVAVPLEQVTEDETPPILVKIGGVAVEVRTGFEPSVFAAVVRTLKALC